MLCFDLRRVRRSEVRFDKGQAETVLAEGLAHFVPEEIDSFLLSICFGFLFFLNLEASALLLLGLISHFSLLAAETRELV